MTPLEHAGEAILELAKQRIAYLDKAIPEFLQEKEMLVKKVAEVERIGGMRSVAGVADNHVTQNPPVQQGARDPWSFYDWKTNSRGEWAFADDDKLKVLAAKIGPQKGNVYIDGGYSYTITVGNNGKRFLNRTPVKAK